MLTTSLITGDAPLPDGDAAQSGELIFKLTGWDTETNNVILPGPKRVVLNGISIPSGTNLWRNIEGLRATRYQVTARWTVRDRYEDRRMDRDLGLIYVGNDASYTLAELLNSGAGVPIPFDRNMKGVGSFPDRPALVSYIAVEGAVVGQNYYDGVNWYHGVSGATGIVDLPGLVAVSTSVRPYDHRGSAVTQLPAPGTDEWLFTEFPADGLAGHANTIHGAGTLAGAIDLATGAAPNVSRVSSFGSANLQKLVEGSRLEAFGSSVMRFTKYGERNTGVGSLVMQLAGANLTDDPLSRYYNHDMLYNAGTTIDNPAWDFEGLETRRPGTRAMIASWKTTVAWAAITTDFQRNVGIGRDAAVELIKGSRNVNIGYRSGAYGLDVSDNTNIGNEAGHDNMFGVGNTNVGLGAGRGNQTGDNNTIIGKEGCNLFGTSNRNTGLGYRNGYDCFGGDNNLYLGPYAGYQDRLVSHTARFYVQGGSTGYMVGDMSKGSLALGVGASFTNLIDDSIVVRADKTKKSALAFTDQDASNRGGVGYDHATDKLTLRAGGADKLSIVAAGITPLAPILITDPRNLPGVVIAPFGTAVRSAVTGTTTETTLYTVTIPGGWIGANGWIRIRTEVSQTNNANNKTFRVKFGGTAIVNSIGSYTSTAGTSRITQLHNRNSQTDQVGHGATAADDPGKTSVAVSTYTVNTASDAVLEITGQLANSADELALEAVSIEICYKP